MVVLVVLVSVVDVDGRPAVLMDAMVPVPIPMPVTFPVSVIAVLNPRRHHDRGSRSYGRRHHDRGVQKICRPRAKPLPVQLSRTPSVANENPTWQQGEGDFARRLIHGKSGLQPILVSDKGWRAKLLAPLANSLQALGYASLIERESCSPFTWPLLVESPPISYSRHRPA
jgi:hypothetical protein